MSDLSIHYDQRYTVANAFKQRLWLYEGLIYLIANKIKLREWQSILDVGCGQGMFSYILSQFGSDVTGVDISSQAILSAWSKYSHRARFLKWDVFTQKIPRQYDCVFVRSLSLYNTSLDSMTAYDCTRKLLEYVKPGGHLVFMHNTRLGKTCDTWRYHSVEDVEWHFGCKAYFSLRLDALLLGSWSLWRPVQAINKWISRRFGLGGEIVCILKKA